jgi:RNA polymerase sigma factor for flagellar operon FliA
MDDLVGAGVQGLVDAVNKFDLTKHVPLWTYARHRIRGSILDGLRALDPASRDMRIKQRRVEKVYRELVSGLRRPIDDEEISSALGVSLARWYRILAELDFLGLDGWPRRTAGGATQARLAAEEPEVASSQAAPWELCFRREQREVLDRALVRLPERERLVISLYYRRELSMKEIAARLGVTESRISQLHTAALDHLKARVQILLRPSMLPLPPQTESLEVGPISLKESVAEPMSSR